MHLKEAMKILKEEHYDLDFGRKSNPSHSLIQNLNKTNSKMFNSMKELDQCADKLNDLINDFNNGNVSVDDMDMRLGVLSNKIEYQVDLIKDICIHLNNVDLKS